MFRGKHGTKMLEYVLETSVGGLEKQRWMLGIMVSERLVEGEGGGG